MNFYPHHISDFNNATRHLTRVERSVYRDAIELYYDKEQPLPDDIELLNRKLLCVADEEKRALSTILGEFFTLSDDGYRHSRCDAEIEKYRKNTSAKAKAGIASAAKRQQKPTGVQQKLTRVHNQEPLTNNQEPRTKEDSADKSPPRGKPLRTLAGYIEDRKTQSLKIIPDDHAVFSYASQAGIPHEYLQLAWIEFKTRYTASPDDSKKYRDWGAVFLKAVKGNWLKVWYIEAGEYKLTTVGQQADMVRRRNGN